MKIPFDIKYRPEIESGKYKVQTTYGREVRIVCWDKRAGEREQIVVLVPTEQGDQETCMLYSRNGILISASQNERYKLVIVTPEPELTEFEEGLVDFYNKRTMVLPDKDGVYNKHDCEELLHESAKELLEIAKKELCHDCKEYSRGYQEGLRSGKLYEYHGPTIPTWYPPCYYGGPCTNPQHDCICCPRQSTIWISTTTGTSDLKAQNNE